ncbi:MAG: sorbosone dehydrogenase family protein [Rhizobacter sp.]|nr:sorbosone dehydrogenase family protein [Chlorobiales bacterium]
MQLAFIVSITLQSAAAQSPDNLVKDAKGTAAPFKSAVLVPKKIEVKLTDLPKPYASESARNSAGIVKRPANAVMNIPEGFTVNIFCENLERPRWMALAPNGDIVLAESDKNRIRILRDANKDGAAEAVYNFDDGLTKPFGLAFKDGYLYVANTNSVIRYKYQPGQTRKTAEPETFVAKISDGSFYNNHWTRNLLFTEKEMFLSVGSATNASVEDAPRASVQTIQADGKAIKTFGYGLRNPVGLAVNPVTKELWTTVNERDELGDDLVPDYLTSVKDGGFYGWPYAYLAPENLDPRHLKGGKSVRPELVKLTRTPDVLFQSHSAALGLAFYTGDKFPVSYQGDAFVAMRGSWNRNEATGYKIVRVPFDKEGKPEGGYEDFLTGFLLDAKKPEAFGRPVGVLVAADGSLLIADEIGGVIWRVSYSGKK